MSLTKQGGDAKIFSYQELLALARTDFPTFAELTFPTLHNGKTLKYAPYIDVIGNRLMRCVWRDRTRMIVNLPPGFMKSLLISVLFVAWRLGVNPGEKFICGSYGDDLAHKLGRMTRDVMLSPQYKAIFPDTVLTKTAENCLETKQGGCRYATSVGSEIAGFRADFIIIDDPMQPDDAYSAVAKQKLWDWYQGVIAQRLIGNGVIIVVMHRLAPDDFCGRLGESQNWYVLRLPLIAEEAIKYVDHKNRLIWAVKPGDLLNPAYKNQAEVDQLKRELLSEIFDAQYQQRPRYGGTGLIDLTRCVRYALKAKYELIIHVWDIAGTKGGGDYTVCMSFGLTNDPVLGDVFELIGVIRMRIELPDVREAIILQDKVGKPALIIMDGNGIGLGVFQDLRKGNSDRSGMKHLVRGDAVEQVNAANLKSRRFHLALLVIYDGKIRFPSSMQGLDALLQEIAVFPEGKNDDQVDCLSIVGARFAQIIKLARRAARGEPV